MSALFRFSSRKLVKFTKNGVDVVQVILLFFGNVGDLGQGEFRARVKMVGVAHVRGGDFAGGV